MAKQKKDRSAEEKILIAAKNIFITKGLDGARMQDIADEAKINKALLHYYFRNKESLFEVIFKEAISNFIPRILSIIDADVPLFDKIRIFTGEYITTISENPYLPLFIMNEINKRPRSVVEKVFGDKRPDLTKLVLQIEGEIKAGIIKNISPVQLIVNMLSICIFPFIAKPMIQQVIKMDELQFRHFMEQRKTEVSNFIIDSIKSNTT